MRRILVTVPLVAALALGALAIATPDAFAGGKGKGNGNGNNPPPIPPDCPCEATIEIAPGLFCTLESCAELVPGGFECNYVCPFPF